MILKINKSGVNEVELLNRSCDIIREIKKSIGLYSDLNDHIQEIVISKFLTEDELYGLHQQCDCFVGASSGEAFCIPAFDAVGFGNEVLVNKNSSMAEYSHDKNMLVDSNKEHAISKDKPLKFLYNGRDFWYKIDDYDLSIKMRQTYEQFKDNKNKYNASLKQYSYETVAQKMKELL